MSARPIWPDELLDLADMLAGRAAGAGRPRSVHLRRAVSSAYYGLFHEPTLQATDGLLGGGSPTAQPYGQVTRWFAHTDLKELAEAVLAVGRPRQRPVAAAFVSVHPDLVMIADAFVALQDARHQADYDHTYDISKSAALALIDQAKDAVRRLRGPYLADDQSYLVFMRLMVGSTRIAKKR
jgi:hypothetical protein